MTNDHLVQISQFVRSFRGFIKVAALFTPRAVAIALLPSWNGSGEVEELSA